MEDKTRVLFVCTGNIIRSALAEYMLRHLAEQAGVADKYEIDSAGIISYHVGELPDSRMRKVARQHGLSLDGRARQLTHQDLQHFDVILAMDHSHFNDILRMDGGSQIENKLFMMRKFDSPSAPEASVPDPYYGDMNGFHETYHIVRRSCEGLLKALEGGELERKE